MPEISAAQSVFTGERQPAPEQNCKALLLLFFALFTAALAQQTDEPSHHESGQQKRDDYAHADEHIG